MFTGIITDIGTVRAVHENAGRQLEIASSFAMESVAIGASVACAGVCLTVVGKSADSFRVDVSAETLACTTLGDWQPGSRVNLERPLKVGDELGGHIATGHIDAVGTVTAFDEVGECRRLRIGMTPVVAPFIATKGSITVDGVSLTVNDVGADSFEANIIPHTLENTTFGELGPGARVNLEVDILARYVARLKDMA